MKNRGVVVGIFLLFGLAPLSGDMLQDLLDVMTAPPTARGADNAAPSPAREDFAGRADPDFANWDIDRLDTAAQADYLTGVEKDVILEMNKVRSNPAKYAELYIRPRLRYYNGRNYSVPGQITIATREGAAAVNDCLAALLRAPGVGLLTPEKGLSLAAKAHVLDQSRTGQVGHNGSDRSDPGARMARYGIPGSTWGENIDYGNNTGRDIVISFLVDDGVPSRGHRNNLLNANFTQAGTAVGTHPQYRYMCPIDFARGYVSR